MYTYVFTNIFEILEDSSDTVNNGTGKNVSSQCFHVKFGPLAFFAVTTRLSIYCNINEGVFITECNLIFELV